MITVKTYVHDGYHHIEGDTFWSSKIIKITSWSGKEKSQLYKVVEINPEKSVVRLGYGPNYETITKIYCPTGTSRYGKIVVHKLDYEIKPLSDFKAKTDLVIIPIQYNNFYESYDHQNRKIDPTKLTYQSIMQEMRELKIIKFSKKKNAVKVKYGPFISTKPQEISGDLYTNEIWIGANTEFVVVDEI